MDRSFVVVLVVFVALGFAGVLLIASPTSFVSAPGDVDALRSLGGSLLAAGLAAFLVDTLRWERVRRGR